MVELKIVTKSGKVYAQDLKPSEATDLVMRVFRVGYYSASDEGGLRRTYVPVSNIEHVIVQAKPEPKPAPAETVND